MDHHGVGGKLNGWKAGRDVRRQEMRLVRLTGLTNIFRTYKP